MKLARLRPPGGEAPVDAEIDGDRAWALRPGESVLSALQSGRAPTRGERSWPLSAVELLAPVPATATIYGIGLNYAAHVAETGAAAPEQPIVFVKVSGSIAAPGGPVRCPEVVRRLDYEGELAIVIGRDGQAGGYCIADDVSARDLQGREPQWTRAKGADTFCPLGPWITTPDEVPDPGSLRLRTWVDGDLRQDSSTADLIFGCPELIDFIAQTCTLGPGDVILTGTPSGVGQGMDPPRFLSSGDRVRIEIESLGSIEHEVL